MCMPPHPDATLLACAFLPTVPFSAEQQRVQDSDPSKFSTPEALTSKLRTNPDTEYVLDIEDFRIIDVSVPHALASPPPGMLCDAKTAYALSSCRPIAWRTGTNPTPMKITRQSRHECEK